MTQTVETTTASYHSIQGHTATTKPT